MRFDQDLADSLDAKMLDRALPRAAVDALGGWLADPHRGGRYADGTGRHTTSYRPSSWAGVAPWPAGFADRAEGGRAHVSREDVVAAVGTAMRDGSWSEAFVATQVWGYGLTGYGPHRTGRILARPGSEEAFRAAVSLLANEGATAAYDRLNTLNGLGPAFHTKFLYFAGQVLPSVRGQRPLILDRVLASVLRRHATGVGTAAGHAWAGPIAARIWSDGGWTSHRYGVYLRWMRAAAGQLSAELPGWPTAPDLLELALFDGARQPA
ncbi:hypothetical protein [Streptomyces otsuchiensis]|uniref:8-oxoguanine DNA glycosylase OGG fold protein n=1 Tax=Streptomyces otsuchiensis TaxID=2681388 RepID=UPI00103101FE|nr:hypothetical protein [Streptomyces otsuchiensis]